MTRKIADLVTFRIDDRNSAHVRVSVFVGWIPGQRGHAGQLTFRVAEWEEFISEWEAYADFQERTGSTLAGMWTWGQMKEEP